MGRTSCGGIGGGGPPVGQAEIVHFMGFVKEGDGSRMPPPLFRAVRRGGYTAPFSILRLPLWPRVLTQTNQFFHGGGQEFVLVIKDAVVPPQRYPF